MKFNLHLVPDERTNAYAHEVNARIRAVAPGAIIFGEESPMAPHMTLVGGEIDDAQIPALIDATREALVAQSQITLHVHPPRIESVYHHWIDSSTDGGDHAQALYGALRSALEGRFIAPRTKSWPWRLHLTLGCLDPEDAALHERMSAMLSGIRADFASESSEVEISESGPEGKCVRPIVRIPLIVKSEP